MKRYRFVLLGGFLLGILLANGMGIEILNSYGVLNAYFLEQFLYGTLDQTALFGSVLSQRLQVCSYLILLDLLIQNTLFQKSIGALFSMFLGIYLTAAISNFGIKGIVLGFLLLFPQWIFYGAAFAFFCYGARRREKRGMVVHAGYHTKKEILFHIFFFVGFLCLVLLGCALESSLNPIILKKTIKMLKFF